MNKETTTFEPKNFVIITMLQLLTAKLSSNKPAIPGCRLLCCLLLYLLTTFSAMSQVKDSIVVKDSTVVYEKIEKFSEKRKFTKFVHKLIFQPVKSRNSGKTNRVKRVKPISYRKYEGKIIRNITITTLDPFGYSETDTTRRPTKKLSELGNKAHIKTKQFAIRNILLIKKNQPLDSLLMKESERLIRTQQFVRGVVVQPIIIASSKDSVDVDIRVLDSWSLIPNISGSTSRTNFYLKERNFLGMGHQWENRYQRELDTKKNAYSTKYTIPNMMNTFISTAVEYDIDLDDNYRKSLDFERPFVSAFTRWGAGVYFDQQFQSDTIANQENIYKSQNFKYNSQDYWAGVSFNIFKGGVQNDRTTNLIFTARFLNKDYVERPEVAFDPVSFYSSEKFFLTGLALTSRKYVQDKYIFNYGVIEDVPVGRIIGISAGTLRKNGYNYPYAGVKFSIGRYYDWGYISGNCEYGTFFANNSTVRTAFTVQANYFTNLLPFHNWNIRQFVKFRSVIGNNREHSKGDMININEENGINGFNSSELYGDKKMMLTLQTQGYSPWNLGGFRVNPYMSYTFAMLGDTTADLFSSRLYSQAVIGVIISNDYLVFSSFQLSLAYYPSLPGDGRNLIKTNSFKTSDFGFQDFEIGKPEQVDYR